MFASGKTAAVASAANYIEDVFSTYLYTGNGSTQTITNGIDLAGKGGLVWLKCRNSAENNEVYDTVRGPNQRLITNTTGAQVDRASSMAFSSTGLSWVGDNISNTNGNTYASWTFRKQPKFFDVVTWSGNGTIGRTISHSLGSEPGCIIVKKTNTTGASDWVVYHRSLGATKAMILNLTDSVYTWNVWNDTAPTSTVFSLNDASEVNGVGNTYVAYLFAHNAGGFGLTGTDNVISCGSFTAGTGSVNLGYEPQWIMFKGITGSNEWIMFDTMRGWPTEAPNKLLMAQSSAAEGDTYVNCQPTATGFKYNFSPDCIYIAIRRGPMKVPTSGTSVFQPIAYTGNGTSQSITTGITGDLTYIKYRTDAGAATFWFDRLRNPKAYLESNSTAAEVTGTQHITAFNQLGFSVGNNGNVNDSGGTFISQTFQRAPSFFDEVCYTGTGSNLTVNHNLGVAPEIIIIKRRSSATSNNNWYCGWNMNSSTYMEAILNTSDAGTLYNYSNWFTSAPTSTTFAIAGGGNVNANTATYVAYLFATCAGVSKVGSYTGTGTTQTIDCGFTGGARFVLIKRTDSTGDWYVWDSARGIVAGNDPYLLLNSTAAETTGTDYIDTYSAGFEISSTAPAAINASGGTFIFLAIA